MSILCDNLLKASINREIVHQGYGAKEYDRVTISLPVGTLPYVDLTEVQQIYHVSPKKFYYLTVQDWRNL